MAHALTVVTGVAGTTIAATCNGADTGTQVESGDLNGALQSVCNDLATISTGNCTIAGNKTFSGVVTCTNAWAWSGGSAGVQIGTGAFLTQESDAQPVRLLGRKRLWRARVAVADANKTLGVYAGTGVDHAGDRFTLPASPGAARTYKLKSTGTGTTPEDTETIDVFWESVGGAPGTVYTIKDETGATTIATFVKSAITATTLLYHARFEFTGGAWSLAENSGAAYDGVTDYGVLPG